MSPFEVAMLACFGASWPFSIAKSLRTHDVAGKSPAFLAIVAAGYGCGIVHKLLYAFDWVVALYALNLMMVLVDLVLYFRYSRMDDRSAPNGVHPVAGGAWRSNAAARAPGRG